MSEEQNKQENNNKKLNFKFLQTCIPELHRLNITLANYFDVAPDLINGITISQNTRR